MHANDGVCACVGCKLEVKHPDELLPYAESVATIRMKNMKTTLKLNLLQKVAR